jgi:hypothetical protein
MSKKLFFLLRGFFLLILNEAEGQFIRFSADGQKLYISKSVFSLAFGVVLISRTLRTLTFLSI